MQKSASVGWAGTRGSVGCRVLHAALEAALGGRGVRAVLALLVAALLAGKASSDPVLLGETAKVTEDVFLVR